MRSTAAAILRAATAFIWLSVAMLLAVAPAQPQSFEDYAFGSRDRTEAAVSEDREPDLRDYARIAETYAAGSAIDMTQRQVSEFRGALIAVLTRSPNVAEDAIAALRAASPTGQPAFFLGLLVFLGFLIGIGRAVALLFAVYVARPVFVRMQKPNPVGMVQKLPVLAARVLMQVMIIAITLAVAVVIGAGFYPDDDAAAVRAAIIVFVAYGAVRLVDTSWRMTLAPYLPNYRLPTLTDRDAERLYRWLYFIALFEAIKWGVLFWLRSLEMQSQSLALLRIVLEFAAATLVLAGAWANRRAVGGALLDGREPREATWLSRGFATLWLPALVLYVAGSWLVTSWRLVMGVEPGLPPLPVAFAVVMAGLLVYAATVYVVERVSRRRAARIAAGAETPETARADAVATRDIRADGGEMGGDDEEGGGAAPAPSPSAGPAGSPGRMTTFEDLARRVASLFAIGAAVWALTWLWGGRAAFAEGTPLDVAQDVVDILFIGYVAYHAVRIWIDQRIAAEGGFDVEPEPGDEGGGASAASRLATLLPLVRNFVLVLIVSASAIFVMMELGVNVAPILGGAGVIGLAIGFGSQTLIRDILSGAFFLIDDAFRKGEYIDVGDVKGTVEQISLRSFQLRHHLGALHTIPFGEIKHLTNFSRDWVMMKLPLRLTYDTDPEKVRKLIKKLGQELLEHPEEGHKFMQPLKSQGVYMMEDSAMIIRVKYMTRPGDQWTTRKLVYSRIRELFEREGIRFAHREVTVRIPELHSTDRRELSDEERHAIGAAARRAVDDADEAAAARPRLVGDDR